MQETCESYSDAQITQCLLTRDFSAISNQMVDNHVTKIRPYGFYNAANLNVVSFPAVTEIGDCAFNNSRAGYQVGYMDIPWGQLEKIGWYAFNGYTTLPETLTLSKATDIGISAFCQIGTHNIKTLSLPLWTGACSDSVAGKSYDETIPEDGQFTVQTNLNSVSAPNMTFVPASCFYGCTSLPTIKLPKVSRVDVSAFGNCTALTKVDLGGNVSKINTGAFYGCTALKALVLRNVQGVASLETNAFVNTAIANGTGYIYVPYNFVNAYKSMTGWSTYADQIRAIESYPEIYNG